MVKILWIDDKKEDKKHKAKRCGVNTQANLLYPDEVSFNKVDCEEYDLIIIDYLLKDYNKRGFYGYAFANVLREYIRPTPIYIASEADLTKNEYKDIAYYCERNFENIINLGDNFRPKKVFEEAKEFARLKGEVKKKSYDIQSYFKDILRAPDSCEMHLRKITINKFGDEIKFDQSLVVKSFSWLMRELLREPPQYRYDDKMRRLRPAGPLFDTEEIIAHLGVSKNCFESIKKYFKKAKYNGAFSSSISQLWWVEEVNRIIFSDKKVKYESTPSIPELIKKIHNVKTNQMAVCRACGRRGPEVLAKKDQTKDTFGPVHYGCSELDEERERKLHFYEPRKFTEWQKESRSQ